MLQVRLFDLVELLLARLIVFERCRIKEISVALRLFENVQCHFKGRILKFDDKIYKNFIFAGTVRTYIELLSYFPELLRHPVGNNRNIL